MVSILLLAGCKSQGDQPVSAASVLASDRPNTTSFTRGSGGSVTTTLGYGIKVDPNSSLNREWITAHDSLAPMDFDGTVGVTTVYKTGGEYSTGQYNYHASVPLVFKQDVAAFEIRFVLFDVWGEFAKTLSYTEVEDNGAGTKKTFTPDWSVYSENEVSEHYASLAYLARVRTKSGRVFEANYGPVLLEARTISARFKPEWLEPTRLPGRDSTRARK